MARDYDPVKRREYYLRTRQLKGRKRASPVKVHKTAEQIKTEADKLAAYKEFVKLDAELLELKANGKKGSPEYQTKLTRYLKLLQAYEDKYSPKKDFPKSDVGGGDWGPAVGGGDWNSKRRARSASKIGGGDW